MLVLGYLRHIFLSGSSHTSSLKGSKCPGTTIMMGSFVEASHESLAGNAIYCNGSLADSFAVL
jgi:hypothetical protein